MAYGKNPWCKACYREWHRSRYTPSTGADDDVRPCAKCWALYRPKQRRPSLFCSRVCKDESRKAQNKADRIASKQNRDCAWCGGLVSSSMRSDAKFCSSACNSKAHASTRKASTRAGLTNRSGDLISLSYVGERDRWRCGICGGRVSKGLVHPDPRAPSLDHVVPLSLGGAPTDPTNLQLSHLRCNLRKGNTPTGEQLRLIG